MSGLAYELSDRMSAGGQAVLADLDLDGNQDLVRAETDAGVTRLHAEFGASAVFTSVASVVHPEAYVTRLVAADWDGDGDPDLLSLGSHSALGPFRMRRWRNEGMQDGQWRGLSDAGLLDLTSTMPINSKPAVLLEDVNYDGRVDLILGAQQLEVRFGIGAGAFASPVRYGRSSTGRTVVAGDMDGDDDLDLVTAVPGEPGRLMILMNDGDGYFEEQQQLTTGQQPWHLALGDVDADGDLDVAMAHRWFDEGLSLWLNEGDGRLNEDRRRFPLAGNPIEVAWNDIDGDRDLDLVVATAYAQHVPQWRQVDGGTVVLINRGNGRLDEPLYLACCEPSSLLVEDLDRDQMAEIVTSGENSLVIRSSPNSPLMPDAWKFTANDTLIADSLQVLSEDVNGDARADIVSLDRKRQELTITLSQANAPFIILPPMPITGSHVYSQRSVDNRVDLIVAAEKPSGEWQLTRLAGHGDGTFAASASFHLPGPLAENQPFVDYDGDGDDDLVVHSPVPQVWIADERGVFRAGPDLPANKNESWRWADLDADGHLDLVVWDDEASVVRAWNQYPGGLPWRLSATLAFQGPIADVLVTDADGNGRADLLVNERLSTTSQVTIMRHQEDESYTLWRTVPTNGALQDLTAADVNGDGRIDLIASTVDSETGLTRGVTVFQATESDSEDRQWERAEFPLEIRNSLGGSQATGAFRVIDLNRDGRDDVVMPMSFWGRTGPQPGGALAVWMGSPSGLAPPVYHVYQDAGYFQTIELHDVDGDGWSDVIASGDAGFALVMQRRPEQVAGDVTGDGQVTHADVNRFCAAIHDVPTEPEFARFDLHRDGQIDRADHAYLIDRILRTTAGDANLDGIFDSRDLLMVFQAGRFELGSDALWEDGDWNCDGRFDTTDLLVAFQAGKYR